MKHGLQKMRYLGEPFVRPDDFLAEMMKSDFQMKKVQKRLELETVKIDAVQRRKNAMKSGRSGKIKKAHKKRR